jgi:hypothetical protein
MPVVAKLTYQYLIPVAIEPSTQQSSNWARGTKDNAQKLITNLQAVVPDATRYGDNVVGPAVAQWRNFVNPAYVSRNGETAASITNKMAARMMDSATKYLNNVKQAFDNDGAQYKAAVDAKQANWGNKQGGLTNYVLPVTGSRATGFLCIPFTINALTGRQKAMRMLGDTMIKGSLIDIVKPGLGGQFRGSLTSLLTSMYRAFYYRLQTPDEINGRIATLANSFVNTAVCNPFAWPVVPQSSALYYAPGGGNNQLCCQIVFGTP